MLYKKSLNKIISNKKIDDLYKYFIDNGALGGKLLGAGGGGFMIFIYHLKTKKFFEKNRNIKKVPFNFTNDGSRIIFTQND